MGVTLAKPVPADVPVLVAPHRVVRLDVFDVPTSLREHTHTMIGAMNGPVVMGNWWTMGEFTHQGERCTLTARPTHAGMEYGHTPAMPPRVLLLECSRCPDVRPDAELTAGGVSLGARCVFFDCDGTYRPIR